MGRCTSLAAQYTASPLIFRLVCVHHDANAHLLLCLQRELACRVAWEEVACSGKLRTVFTGNLLQTLFPDAKSQISVLFVVRGTYIANTCVIGALSSTVKTACVSWALLIDA
jgi:hypothetical protein